MHGCIVKLDAALNNISQALCMFDLQGQRPKQELKRLHATIEEAKSKADNAAPQTRAAHQQLIDASNLMADGFVSVDTEDHVICADEILFPSEPLAKLNEIYWKCSRNIYGRFAGFQV